MDEIILLHEAYHPTAENGLATHDLMLYLGSGGLIPMLTIQDRHRISTVPIQFDPGALDALSITVKAVPRGSAGTPDGAADLGTVVIHPGRQDMSFRVTFTLAISDGILFTRIESETAFTAELVRPAAEALSRLTRMIGLTAVKEQVNAHLAFMDVQDRRRQMGLPWVEVSRHLVFLGNPGTGKSTVARLIAEIYRARGICRTDAFVETDRSTLVAGYVGQTAIRTLDALQRARGGVLLIDEAHELVPKGEALSSTDFGLEVIATLNKYMEDHRDDIIVIVAGYKDEMPRFINANQGLRQRFKTFIEFEDYSAADMMAIFDNICQEKHYQVEAEGENRTMIESHFVDLATSRRPGFANGRSVRNVFEVCIEEQAKRVSSLVDPTSEQMQTITYADVVNTIYPERRTGES